MTTDPMTRPDAGGHFGTFGGRFVPEALVPACVELEAAFGDAWHDASFVDEFDESALQLFEGRVFGDEKILIRLANGIEGGMLLHPLHFTDLRRGLSKNKVKLLD